MKFGLIGAGMIGGLRTQALRQAQGCELIAVADVDEKRAKALASLCNARAFKNFQELLSLKELDSVVVSTPPQFHEKIVLSSLESGKNVICEKPLGSTVESCRKMVETARRFKKTLTTGFNHRYFPAVQVVKKAITDGIIGELNHVRAFTGHTGLSEFEASWMHDKDIMGGGALMDNGIHMIDLARYMLDEVNEVYGFATNEVWKLDRSEDNGFALMRSPRGKIATLQASWSEWKGYHFYIEAYGDKGMAGAYYAPMKSVVISMDKPGGRPHRKVDFYPRLILKEKLKGWQSTAIQTFKEEFSDFVQLAQGVNGKYIIADGFAGFRAVEIANAVYRGSQERKPIYLIDPVEMANKNE